MTAPQTFGPLDPFKHARIAGGMTMHAVQAAQAIMRGKPDEAMEYLRTGLEQYDAFWADHLWPRVTPPALPEAEMAQLIREDETEDRRVADWERAKEIADRNGEAN